LLASYHSVLSGAAKSSEALAISNEFKDWLQRNVGHDFTDPKGGDPASWFEAAELLRGELLAAHP
jgi:hypothetical protein